MDIIIHNRHITLRYLPAKIIELLENHLMDLITQYIYFTVHPFLIRHVYILNNILVKIIKYTYYTPHDSRVSLPLLFMTITKLLN